MSDARNNLMAAIRKRGINLAKATGNESYKTLPEERVVVSAEKREKAAKQAQEGLQEGGPQPAPPSPAPKAQSTAAPKAQSTAAPKTPAKAPKAQSTAAPKAPAKAPAQSTAAPKAQSTAAPKTPAKAPAQSTAAPKTPAKPPPAPPPPPAPTPAPTPTPAPKAKTPVKINTDSSSYLIRPAIFESFKPSKIIKEIEEDVDFIHIQLDNDESKLQEIDQKIEEINNMDLDCKCMKYQVIDINEQILVVLCIYLMKTD